MSHLVHGGFQRKCARGFARPAHPDRYTSIETNKAIAGTYVGTGVHELGLEVRIGIHVGECELHDRKPTGLAVNIAARVAQAARPGEVVVTRTARDLVAGADLSFTNRGEHVLKGVPGPWKLYALGS